MRTVLLIFILCLAPHLACNAAESDQITPSNITKNLNRVVGFKDKILFGSKLGQYPIYLSDSITNQHYLLSPQKTSYRLTKLVDEKIIRHIQKELSCDSLYSSVTNSNIAENFLVVQISQECMQNIFIKSNANQSMLDMLLTSSWVVALIYHESLHSFEQKEWSLAYKFNVCVEVQEGTAFLVEAKTYSLLNYGDLSFVSKFIEKYKELFSADMAFENFYSNPAMKLFNYENNTKKSVLKGLSHKELDLCNR